MYIQQHNQWTRLNERVNNYYLNHPHMIAELLRKIGARDIKTGDREIRCTCPLHKGDNSQAFVVWMDRGIVTFSCYSRCHTKGDLARLLMKRYRVPFEKAVQSLARLAGLTVTGDVITVSRQTLEEESIIDFKRRLGIDRNDSQPNIFPESWVDFSLRMSHDYFLRRGFSQSVLQKFQVGFVPAKTWLIPDPKDPSKTQGWFVDRISIPWRDRYGNCIGFAGRRVDNVDHLKYQTFPGTKKALALYGLNEPLCQETIKRTRVLHLVEGYSDVWRGWMHECYNIVSGGGTELTPAQLNLIASFDLAHVVLYMDGDDAGQLASARIGEQLSRMVRVMTATPPQGRDPGDLIDYRDFWTPIVQAKPFCPRRKS